MKPLSLCNSSSSQAVTSLQKLSSQDSVVANVSCRFSISITQSKNRPLSFLCDADEPHGDTWWDGVGMRANMIEIGRALRTIHGMGRNGDDLQYRVTV